MGLFHDRVDEGKDPALTGDDTGGRVEEKVREEMKKWRKERIN
jgi:hypothetical protein